MRQTPFSNTFILISQPGKVTIFQTTEKNPFINKIDYILTHTSWKSSNSDAKFINNLKTYGDHKIVISKFNINWEKIYRKTNSNKNISIEHVKKVEVKEAYRENFFHDLEKINRNSNQEHWSSLCDLFVCNSEKLKPKQFKNKQNDLEIEQLSNQQKNIKLRL